MVYCPVWDIFTFGLNIIHTSTVKIVALLLKADDKDDMRAAIMTAIIKPTRPVGRTFKTSLKKKTFAAVKKMKY